MRRKLQRLTVSKALPALCLAGLALTASHGSAADACLAPQQRPQLELHLQHDEPDIDHSHDSAAMAVLLTQHGRASKNHLTHLYGLTTAELISYYDVTFAVAEQGSGHCVTLRRAEVHVGYQAMTIYINRDFAEDSCGYQAILKHELQHVELNNKILSAQGPVLEATLRRLEAATPLRSALFDDNAAAAKASFVALLEAEIAPHLRAMAEEQQRKHDWIDRRESYQQVLAKCDHQ